jgi:hypothetical protein
MSSSSSPPPSPAPAVPPPERPAARRSWLRLAFALGVSSALAVGLARAQGQTVLPAYRVIVHPANSASVVERKFLAHAFLKKVTVWGDGETIRPVDLLSNSPTRSRFSQEILERAIPAVRSYWQQMIFSGRGVPPPELDNDDAVIRFVSKHPGAVGYVSGSADVHTTKVLLVR